MCHVCSYLLFWNFQEDVASTTLAKRINAGASNGNNNNNSSSNGSSNNKSNNNNPAEVIIKDKYDPSLKLLNASSSCSATYRSACNVSEELLKKIIEIVVSVTKSTDGVVRYETVFHGVRFISLHADRYEISLNFYWYEYFDNILLFLIFFFSCTFFYSYSAASLSSVATSKEFEQFVAATTELQKVDISMWFSIVFLVYYYYCSHC